MKRKAYALALFLVLATAGTAAAQNLLVNPNFNSDVSGWSFTTPGTFTWDSSLDADSNPSSGSGRLDNTSPAAFGTSFAAQCVAVTGGSSYDFSAQIRIPSGQTDTGYAAVVANFYNAASCGGSNVGGTSTPQVLSTTTNTWVLSQVLAFAAPGTAVSAQVSLWVNKTEDTGSLVVNFDNAFFGLAGSPTPTATTTATVTATATPTATATVTPTTNPAATPTATPTVTPTTNPAATPTTTPTVTPTTNPAATPTTNPAGTGNPIPAAGGGGLVIFIVLLVGTALLVLGRRAV